MIGHQPQSRCGVGSDEPLPRVTMAHCHLPSRAGPETARRTWTSSIPENWLFIGHPEAGWRSAVIYSVIVSCRRRGIDPWEYVRDVLKRLPGMKQSEVPTLLPRCWKPLDSSER